MDYKYISQFHKNPPNIRIFREQSIQQKYEKFLRNNPNHISILKNSLFEGNVNWIITPNKFPYHFTDDTEHLIIWFKDKVNYKLIDFLFRDEDVVFFENRPNNKSIAEIPHAHIFKKNKCINK